ncbi:MAG: hypothetical protein AB7O66_12015 [Limisphaerales bacterium]
MRVQLSHKLAAALTSWLSLSPSPAQQRIPISPLPEDQGITIRRSTSGVTLSSSGRLHPLFYRSTADLNLPPGRWTRIASPANTNWVDRGEIAVQTTAEKQNFLAAYGNPATHNGFVRIPTNRPSDDLRTGVIVLHPSTLGPNSGAVFEEEIGPECDRAGLVSSFPSAQERPNNGDNRWNWQLGPQASDFKHIHNVAVEMRRLVPTVEEITLAGYSDGVAPAIGFTQLYPERVARVLLIAGFNNPGTARFAVDRNGGAPIRYARPIPVVGLVSRNDPEFYPEILSACRWFAEANGFTGQPVTNAVKVDLNAKVPGVDATIVAYGPHVNFIISDARTHEDSTYESSNGFRVLYGDFLAKGTMPADNQ